ncbi:MAG: hypothetical protein GY827_00130 [Cytophagales bacterium]|nr:hypothetical protein [Cytophagales bacterium]
MEEIKVLTHISPWYIFLCLLIGAAYSYFLYQKKTHWSRVTNNILASLRFLIVTLVCLLLVGLFFTKIKRTYEKPTVAILIDDSESVVFGKDSIYSQSILSKVDSVGKSLSNKGYNVVYHGLNQTYQSVKQIKFVEQKTNIGSAFKNIQELYEGQNFEGVVLWSDGIYNQGLMPEYQQYNFPIHTIQLGDTLQRKDIVLKRLLYNKVVYAQNRFPIVAEFNSRGFAGRQVEVQLLKADSLLNSKKITLARGEGLQKVRFETVANQEGRVKYEIRIKGFENELTLDNNNQNAYLEVIKAKEKILILSHAPHPRIKMWKTILEKTDKYEVDLVLLGQKQNFQWSKNNEYGLIILNDLPNKNATRHHNLVSRINKEAKSVLHLVGRNTDLNSFNQLGKGLRIVQQLPQTDKVFGTWNTKVERFQFKGERLTFLKDAPPVDVPFAEYELSQGIEVFIYQKLGSVDLDKPLCLYSEQGEQKVGFVIGEGIWRWRLFEYLYSDKQEVLDDLFSKYIALLTVKKDKRRFVVKPVAEELYEGEITRLRVQCFDELFEPLYGQNVRLTLSADEPNSEEITFDFVTNEVSDVHKLKVLPTGVYNYASITKLSGKEYKETGSFVVKKMFVERTDLLAKSELLTRIAQQSGGVSASLGTVFNKFSEYFGKRKIQKVIHSTEKELEIIHFHWICIFIIILISLEWGIRKFSGGY